MSAKPKRKPKAKKDAELSQSERFKAMAQLLGADPTGAGFERAFRAIAPPKRKQKRKTETKTPAK